MRTGSASVDELIAHGGWLIDDAQARHAANPDTFWLPSSDELGQLVPGTTARLIFQIADQADPVVDGLDPYDAEGRPNLVVAHERMWLWVESVAGEGEHAVLVGVLMNMPVATHSRLLPGARVRFRPRDVIDLDLRPSVTMEDEFRWMAEHGLQLLDADFVTSPEDPERDPTIAPSQAEVCERFGVRPERPQPSPFVRCLVGRTVAEDTWPIFGGRWRPNPDRNDCGWSIWATHSDMDVAADADGFETLPVGEVKARCDVAWRYLALPPGWAFVLGPDGFEDVYQDPELLDS
jgi:hypothetical protein